MSVLPVHTRYSLSASGTKPNQRSLLSWGMLDVLFLEIIVQTDDVSLRPSPRSDTGVADGKYISSFCAALASFGVTRG